MLIKNTKFYSHKSIYFNIYHILVYVENYNIVVLQSQAWQQLLEREIGGVRNRLFGGAQYHRAMREFVVS